MLRRDEVQAAGELAAEALGGAGAIVRDVHRGVARRVFGMLGRGRGAGPARPRRDLHARARLGARRPAHACRSGAGRALALASPPDAPRLADSPRGSFALGAINGMWGDRIERDHAAARARARPARRRRAGRQARRVRPRPVRDRRRLGARRRPDLRRAAARGARPHARLRPLQHRPPHLRERARAGRRARGARRGAPGRGDRARRPLDGRPGRAQRLPLRRARRPRVDAGPAPRRLPRLTAPRRPARARRRPRRPPARAGFRRPPRSRACSRPAAPA